MKTILIVDDQEPIRKAVRLVLESKSQHEYQVIEAANGSDALKMIVENKPDLAIVDLMMPKVDGFTMLNEIKLINHEIPVVILTAKTDEATANEVKTNYPKYVLLTKPVDNQHLYDTIVQALNPSP